MNRIFCSIILLCFFSGCEGDWKYVCIKKRIYKDGYYVHFPGSRSTDPTNYPKPNPYPTTNSQATVAQSSVGNGTAVSNIPSYNVPTAGTSQNSNGTSVGGNTVYNVPVQNNSSGGNGSGGIGGGGAQVSQQPVNTVVPNYTVNNAAIPDTSYAVINPLPADTNSPAETPVVPEKSRNHHPLPDGESSVVAQLGLINGQPDFGFPVKWNSFSTSVGFRYKINPAKNHYGVVDIGYRFNQFYINQNKPKVFPLTSEKHQRERVSMNDLSAAYCQRIQINNNAQLKWIDLGMFGDWSFRTSNVFIDEHADANSPVGKRYKIKTKITGLAYLQKWNYGVTVRAGGKYCNVFAMWRLNKTVMDTPDSRYHDLPKLIVGIEYSPEE